MSDETSIRAHFLDQARACETLGSPFTAQVCRILSTGLERSTLTGRRVLEWQGDPYADALALRLCGALHAIVLAGSDEALTAVYPPRGANPGRLTEFLLAAVERHDRQLSEAIERPPQTNEVMRSAMLLPGLLAVARQTDRGLDLAEIGSSAGLNLHFNRFRYDYDGVSWGSPDSPVVLSPEVRGRRPDLGGGLTIVARDGCDLAPVRLEDDADRLRLRSFVWADQTARLERLDAAIRVALEGPVDVTAGDAVDFVRRKLVGRRRDATFVLFHSIMWQYMPQKSRDAIRDAMHAAGAKATKRDPLAWVSMEPSRGNDHAVLRVTLWPEGDTRRLAHCDFHGRWIEAL